LPADQTYAEIAYAVAGSYGAHDGGHVSQIIADGDVRLCGAVRLCMGLPPSRGLLRDWTA